MAAATIIFPHQLYKNHPAVKNGQLTILIEETLFFKQYNFHKKKLILHRASMKAYESYLSENKIPILYIESESELSDVRLLIKHLGKKDIDHIEMVSPVDEWLGKRINKTAEGLKIVLTIYDSPGFLNTAAGVAPFFNEQEKYFQTTFYIQQRKNLNLLLTGKGQPEGGKWSYDHENRKKFPANTPVPITPKMLMTKFTREAIRYIEQKFPENYGTSADFFYPVCHDDADTWLNNFIEHRLKDFGVYEDAIVSVGHILNHSVLSPLLNIGLLLPADVISRVTESAARYSIPINSLEGFIRQIIGWREFIHVIYEREGTVQRTRNFWNFKRRIPQSFWQGTTGIPPLDCTIRKILDTGYCHHIERLMVIGNFMLLCEFDPDEVYRWFMELFIDSYDWVMVPNVYGLSQFADGGLMTTKPYISGSNYLLKMSNYKKGKWTEVWDGLFWRFLEKHREIFQTNNRWAMLLKTLDKMDHEKKNNHNKTAERFLKELDNPASGDIKNTELF